MFIGWGREVLGYSSSPISSSYLPMLIPPLTTFPSLRSYLLLASFPFHLTSPILPVSYPSTLSFVSFLFLHCSLFSSLTSSLFHLNPPPFTFPFSLSLCHPSRINILSLSLIPILPVPPFMFSSHCSLLPSISHSSFPSPTSFFQAP